MKEEEGSRYEKKSKTGRSNFSSLHFRKFVTGGRACGNWELRMNRVVLGVPACSPQKPSLRVTRGTLGQASSINRIVAMT